MVNADEDFSNEEKMIIDAHCMEMHIDNNQYEPHLPLDEVLKRIKDNFSAREKHIVFLELAGAILADGILHEGEQKLVSLLKECLELSQDEIDRAYLIMSEMKSVYEKCAKYVR